MVLKAYLVRGKAAPRSTASGNPRFQAGAATGCGGSGQGLVIPCQFRTRSQNILCGHLDIEEGPLNERPQDYFRDTRRGVLIGSICTGYILGAFAFPWIEREGVR